MILVAPRVPPSVVDWINFSRLSFLPFLCLPPSPSLRVRQVFAAIPVFFFAVVWSPTRRNGQGKPLTSHFSLITNRSGRKSA
jgi:hypothetical protein